MRASAILARSFESKDAVKKTNHAHNNKKEEPKRFSKFLQSPSQKKKHRPRAAYVVCVCAYVGSEREREREGERVKESLRIGLFTKQRHLREEVFIFTELVC